MASNSVTPATPPHTITLEKPNSPVAREINKMRENGSSDTEIVNYLVQTDGLSKPLTPCTNTNDNNNIDITNKPDSITKSKIPVPNPPSVKRKFGNEEKALNNNNTPPKRSLEGTVIILILDRMRLKK